MARKMTMDNLQAEKERLEKEMKVQRQNLRALKRQEAELNRRERTHRLCIHGGMLEQYLNPEEFTDEQIDRIMKLIFRRSDIIELLNSVKGEGENQGETQ